MLLCDFHIHTTFSDGSVELTETVDLFGQAGFDVISVTDHVVNGDNSIGVMTNILNMSLTEGDFGDYLNRLLEEKERAWRKYNMLVIPGVEISKNYVSAKKSAHMLILDIQSYIPATWTYEEIFEEAKRQNALIIACHPHHQSNITAHETLFLWNNRNRYAHYIDAWEIANRDDVFSAISLKRYPYIASSDFHKVRHLYSWKTLLNCEKNIESVKQCIRNNRGIAITLFRE